MAEPAKQIIHFSLGLLGQELLDGTEIFRIVIPAESPEEATRKLERLIMKKILRIQQHPENAPLALIRYARNLRRLARVVQNLETAEEEINALVPDDVVRPQDSSLKDLMKRLIKQTSDRGRELEAILQDFPQK